jgi:hypothetical protein
MDHKRRRNVVILIVLLLILGIYGLNAVMQGQWEDIKARREEELERRRRADLGLPPPSDEPQTPPSAFEVPPDTGPDDAPVRLEVYVNSSNDCLASVVYVIKPLSDVYGDLVQIDYRDTLDPEVRAESDDRQIGCEAAIFFNGENVVKAQPGNLTGAKRFQGPPDETDYSTGDVYGAINYILREAGIEPPAEAISRARVITTVPPSSPSE